MAARYFRLTAARGTPALARVGVAGWERFDFDRRAWVASRTVEADVMFSGEWEELDELDAVAGIVAWHGAGLAQTSAAV